MTSDHQLANIRQRELKLAAQRKEILSKDSETALDMLLCAPSPATLIQSFPDQDLYYLMHKIGVDDFIPVLSLARSDQWEHILDMEVWEDDQLNLPVMSRALGLMFQAAPERFLRWIITDKPDYFELFLFKNMEIRIREHDELPPEDFDDYISLDEKFYFRFPDLAKKNQDLDDPSLGDGDVESQVVQPEDTADLIEKMMNTLAAMDLSVFHGLMLETLSLLPAEAEEEQFRLKTIRLAEKGFLPPHEAIGIYQPTDIKHLRKRPAALMKAELNPDTALPPQYVGSQIKGEDLFVTTLSLIDEDLSLQMESELAALINKIISADRVRIREIQAMERTVQKASDTLSLGLEILQKDLAPEPPLKILETYFLEDIFRTGSRAGIQLKTQAQTWYKNSFTLEKNLPLSFLGEDFLGVIGGLFLDRPLYYDNYRTGKLLYRNFKSLADITAIQTILDQIRQTDLTIRALDPDLSSFKLGVLTYKSLLLTLWARNRTGLDKDGHLRLSPIDLNQFKPFFKQLFSSEESLDPSDSPALADLMLFVSDQAGIDEPDMGQGVKAVLKNLVKELEDEYGRLSPEQLDPRFIPHFLLKCV